MTGEREGKGKGGRSKRKEWMGGEGREERRGGERREESRGGEGRGGKWDKERKGVMERGRKGMGG